MLQGILHPVIDKDLHLYPRERSCKHSSSSPPTEHRTPIPIPRKWAYNATHVTCNPPQHRIYAHYHYHYLSCHGDTHLPRFVSNSQFPAGWSGQWLLPARHTLAHLIYQCDSMTVMSIVSVSPGMARPYDR
ncbi:hypothetical protein BDW68DRAFT_159346 [Aspergillus falconensis]